MTGQKGVMISHRNVIANTLQISIYERKQRDSLKGAHQVNGYTETALGLLPMSHIYALVVVVHVSFYRGDEVVVLPKFDFKQTLSAIQNFRIAALYLVSVLALNVSANASDLGC
jgi:acyl-CoA synthetase (AMP-forming)/AMP-acid ligase II